ncbi:glycosyltransferase family 4 protein [Ferruginibacter profundus]
MRKRILIDATTIVEKKDGLSQYIISLLDNLPEEAFVRFDFLVLVHTNVKRKELWDVLDKKKFKVIKAAIAPIGPRREWDMFWFLRQQKRTFDLFHSTSNQYPLSLKNGLATVHDITFKNYLDSKWWTFNMAKRFLNLVIKNALYRSAAVIAVSEYTRQDLVNNYKLNNVISNKISVIYEGWEHLKANAEEKETGDTVPTFKNYLFYVGTTRLHKNMKNLLQAFNIACKKLPADIKLVITGNETYLDETDKAVVSEINAGGERIYFTGFVSGFVLEHLFKNADAFIFPSLSEGFGIPVLEAFYFKKPLLCSNTTSLPEIAGPAALYFNPADTADIAVAIVKFYTEPSIGPELVMKGTKQLELFSWKKMATETVQLYRKLLPTD